MDDYNGDGDFTGDPFMPYDPDSIVPYYGAEPPEGSLIGSGNNDGLTQACKTAMQSNVISFRRDWRAGLVTVGNITKLLVDNKGNTGFVFTSVNGVSYFFAGSKIYDYSMEYYYEVEEGFEFTETDSDPTMEEIEAINNYLSRLAPNMN